LGPLVRLVVLALTVALAETLLLAPGCPLSAAVRGSRPLVLLTIREVLVAVLLLLVLLGCLGLGLLVVILAQPPGTLRDRVEQVLLVLASLVVVLSLVAVLVEAL
jgi:hypothetical protein